jgi:hypothetical protein
MAQAYTPRVISTIAASQSRAQRALADWMPIGLPEPQQGQDPPTPT